MMSQYPLTVIVGSLFDTHGPAICSLTAVFFFSAGFGGVATELRNPSTDLSQPSQTSFYRLIFCYLLIGVATVFA